MGDNVAFPNMKAKAEAEEAQRMLDNRAFQRFVDGHRQALESAWISTMTRKDSYPGEQRDIRERIAADRFALETLVSAMEQMVEMQKAQEKLDERNGGVS